MIWIGLIGAAFVLFIVGWLISRWMQQLPEPETQRTGRIIFWATVGLFVVWISADTAVSSIQQVPAGHIGVIYEFGAIRSQIGEGFHLIPPWQTSLQANIQVQRHHFDKLDAFSKETQDVFVAATLNIRVSPDAIQKLYRTVGPKYFEVLIAPRVHQNFKDETVKYLSVDIAPNRELIRKAVRERLERELSPYSIEVEDLLLENIDFRPEFKQAIEAKQIATQQALEQLARVEVAQRQAEQKVKQAEGEGKAIFLVAEQQAAANELLAASLTESLIRYALIQKLGSQIKVILLPSDQPFILGSEILN